MCRLSLVLMIVLVLLTGGFVACSRSAAPYPDAGIIVLLVDTLRRDALGNEQDLSPSLDRLAREGFVFNRAVAPSCWTKPSVASLMTGLYPGHHGAIRYPWHPQVVGYQGKVPLDPSHETLAEAFKARGYRTAAFVTNPHIISDNHFDQGFDEFVEPAGDAVELLDRARAWLDEALAAEEPFFLYLHLIDPHMPYFPPEDFRQQYARGDPGEKAPFERLGNPKGIVYWTEQFLTWQAEDKEEPFRFDYERILPDIRALSLPGADKVSAEMVRNQVYLDFYGNDDPQLEARVDYLISLYEAEVAYVDTAVDDFLAHLNRSGAFDDCLLVVTGDHGEAFLEHGLWGHGLDVHTEEVDVPLIIRAPAGEHAPTGQSHEPVSLVDLYPTLLEMTGEPMTGGLDGSSLWPIMSGEGSKVRAPRIVFSEVVLNYGDFIAAESEKSKMIRSHWLDGRITWQFYDLLEDPMELAPIDTEVGGPEARNLKRLIELHVKSRDPRFIEEGSDAPMSEDVIRQMRALGYL